MVRSGLHAEMQGMIVGGSFDSMYSVPRVIQRMQVRYNIHIYMSPKVSHLYSQFIYSEPSSEQMVKLVD